MKVQGAVESTARILVVEDDPEIRGTLELLLGARWTVALANGGEAGWHMAQRLPFDLVISDVETPDTGGVELLRRLRANRATQDMSVILMAPATGERDTIAGLEAGADDFLVKPFSGRELLVRVRNRLELAAMRRRNAQQEEALTSLRRTLHVRDEFLAMASHELRTPITTLGLQTEGLLHLGSRRAAGANGEVDERLKRRLGSIRNQVLRLDQLVDQLLDVSRLVEGRLELRRENVDLQGLTAEVIDHLQETAERAGSPVQLRDRPGAVTVGYWDRFRLQQVVTNLLTNAIKFGGGKPIDVEVDADDARATLRVEDHGEGIALEEQGRIFERFERASNGRSHPGLGLGLWISTQIVESLGGAISVDSAPGEGSTFTVRLPRTAGTP